MSGYKLTKDPDKVIRVSDGTLICRGHYLWEQYERWVFAGNTPTPAMSISELVAEKLADINNDYEADIAAIKRGYPDSEVLSWPKQESEARAFLASASAATPLLDSLAGARGLSKADLATRVIAKADAFAQLSGALIGRRQALADALAALSADATPEQVAAIAW